MKRLWLMLVLACAAHFDVLAQAPRSGLEFMSPATQALQLDDTLNPAMLWLKEGEQQWASGSPPAQRACNACHGDARQSMRGVAARYPAFDERLQRPVTLAGRVNECRQRYQQAQALAPESQALLGLETYRNLCGI